MSDKELKSVLEKLSKSVDELAKNVAPNSRVNMSGRGNSPEDATKRLTKTIKTYEEALDDMVRNSTKINADLSKAFKEFNKQFDDVNKITRDTAAGLDKINGLYLRQSKFLKEVIDSDRLTNDAQDRLLSKMKAMTSQFDDIGGAVAKNIKSMSQMVDVIEANTDTLVELNDVMKKNVEVTYDSVDSIEKNIESLKELKEQNRLTTKVTKDLTEAQDKLNDLVDEHKKKLKSLGVSQDAQLATNTDIVKAYREHIESVKGNKTASQEAEAALAQFIAGLHDANDGLRAAVSAEIGRREKLATSIHRTTNAFVESEKVFGPFRQGMKEATESMKAQIGRYMTLGAGLALIVGGVKQLYNEFVKVASAGLARNFAKIAADSIRLGVSIETLTDIIKTNYNTYAQMGVEGFNNAVKDNQDALIRLTGSTEEAARTAAEMATNAKVFGVDLKNRGAMNDSIREQTEQFEILSRVTGETVRQSAINFRQLVETGEVSEKLLGLDARTRQNRIRELGLQNQALRLAGLSNEQAQVAMQNQAAKSKMGLGDRISGAYQLAMQARLFGASAEDTETVRSLSGKVNLSPEEQKRKDEAMARIQAKVAAARREAESENGGMGGGRLEFINRFEEMLGKNQLVRNETELGKNLTKATAEGKAVSQADAIARVLEGRLTNNEVKVVSAIEKLQNLFSSGIAKLLGGILLSLGGIAMLLGKIAMNTGGGFGGLGNLFKKKDALVGPTQPGRLSQAGSWIGSKASALGGKLSAGASAAGAVASKIPGVASAASKIGGVGSKVMGTVSSAGSAAGAGLKAVGKSALKFVPGLGLALVAFDAIGGALSGIDQASSIFGADAVKKGVTASQKISAGIGGALNALSFGLIPTAGTAQMLNGLFTGIGGLFADTIQMGMDFFTIDLPNGLETFFNEGVPKIWEAIKSGIGWLGYTIIEFGKKAIDMIFSDSEVSSGIGDSLMSGIAGVFGIFKTIGTFILKGLTKVALDIASAIPGLSSTDTFKSLAAFASSDTSFGNKAERDKAAASRMTPIEAAAGATHKIIGGVVGPANGSAKNNRAALEAAMNAKGMTDPKERAAFMAQMDHETGGFKYMQELASGQNYEGRADLGNTSAGDGVKYKGRGYIQLTGKANYAKYGQMVGVDLVNNPQLAEDPAIAGKIALAYWNDKKVNGSSLAEQARAGNFDAVTQGINGGANGKADRDTKYASYLSQYNGGSVAATPVGDWSTGGAGTRTVSYQTPVVASGPSSKQAEQAQSGDSKKVVELLTQIRDNTAAMIGSVGQTITQPSGPTSSMVSVAKNKSAALSMQNRDSIYAAI